jgi:hypothetical protein
MKWILKGIACLWLILRVLGLSLLSLLCAVIVLNLSLVCGVIGIVVLLNLWYMTPRDVAYRNQHPLSQACADQRQFSDLFAQDQYRDIKLENGIYQSGEIIAAQDERIKRSLSCVLQEHVLHPKANAKWSNGKEANDLQYFLGFVEFKENGEPYVLMMGNEELDPTQPVISQTDALLTHLKKQTAGGHSNYVIAFIHGWRHDARIGDLNVADLRLYAAYLAWFLKQRCATEDRYCNTTVTAVYIGWRGGRLDETRLKERFGASVDNWLTGLLAAPTLFDRKPVSEQIGPSVLSLLRLISETIGDSDNPGVKSDSRLVVFAHSLGGDLLISALNKTLLTLIREQLPNTRVKLPIGNMIVLLNPASEAANWTSLQSAVRERMSDLRAQRRSCCLEQDKDTVFPANQPPIILSLTSARTWPAGGIRDEDCKKLTKGGGLCEKVPQISQTDQKPSWRVYKPYSIRLGNTRLVSSISRGLPSSSRHPRLAGL